MTVKEYLRQGYLLARGIRFKRERIQELRELAGYASARTDGTPGRKRLPNCASQIDEWEREIDEDMKQMGKVYKTIAGVDNLEYRHLLELRYADGLTWDVIAQKMHYSERQVYYIHGRALERCRDLQLIL